MRGILIGRDFGTMTIVPVFLTLFVIEEFFASRLSTAEGAKIAPSIFSFGHQIYAKSLGVSVVTIYLVIMLISISRNSPKAAITLLSAYVPVVFALYFAITLPLFSAFSIVSPFFTFIVAYSFGRSFRLGNETQFQTYLIRVMFLFNAFVFFRLLWLLLRPKDPRFFPFYDGFTHIILSATIVVTVTMLRSVSSKGISANKLRALLIMAVINYALVLEQSPRRLAIGATILVFLIFVFSTIRFYNALLLTGFLSIPFFPYISNIATATLNYINFGAGSTSDLGHFNDIRRGLEVCLSGNFISASIDPSSIFAARDIGNLYIHNEILQACTTGGQLFGLLGLLLLFIIAIKIVNAIRNNRNSTIAWFCNSILISYAILSQGFPLIYQSVRWQVILGVSLGLLASISSSVSPKIAKLKKESA